MDTNNMAYQVIQPDPSLEDFVESYWMLTMQEETAREVIVLPDGRIDLIFPILLLYPSMSYYWV
ncbi:DUF6597 domain-containing transcriptional factor [Paraflavitalea speifideaquila]|uniref:DUF6597 domain-containing transcriptional factor n=1 Tax=Paraflavitalea speifideaquila TaxID=3076558 RepID=UPI0028EEE755|nr:DUF6597 domain-containing transcriptional factor [Paraflavitalea speifideiaquila]